MLTNQNNIRVQEITPEGVIAGSMPDVDKPEYQEARKEFFKDVAKGAVTAPLTGLADIIEMGAAVPPTASAATNAMQQGFEEAAKYVNREAVEQIIKDVTGIELKGTAGELLGEVVGIPGGPALVSGIGGLVSKYSDDVLRNLDNITDEARELFRTASGGDGTDGMATVTAGASRETVPTSIKPDLPDTSINPSMIGESTPLGASAIDNYERTKDLKPELTEEELFTRTGVYKGADGKFRFELSTVDAELDLGGLDDLKFNGEVELKDLLDFDSLFDAYNERYYSSEAFDYVTPKGLDKLKVRLANNEDYSGSYVHSDSPFSVEGESIELNLSQIDSEQELLSVLLHEVQHAIQAREGFTRGANTEMFYKEVAEKLGLGKNVSKRTHEKELKKLIDNVENTYVFEKFEQTRKRFNRDKGGQDLPEGHPLRDNPFSAFSQGESALINKVIPDILLKRYKQEPYGRIFPTLKLEDYKITIEDVRKHLKGHREFIEFKIGYFDDMYPKDAVQQDFSAAMMESFLDEADEFLSNPKMTPHDVRFIFGKELQDRRSIDVYNEVPRRALLEYKRKYGELEAKAVEERLARRKQLRNETDMEISEIEEQMRKEFPPLDMHIRRNIAEADPEFAKGIDFDREVIGKGFLPGIVPPEKARLDDGFVGDASASAAREAVDETVDTMTAAGLNNASVDDWRKANATSEEFRKRLKGRNPILIELAEARKANEITAKEYREAADAFRPIRTVDRVPKPATTTEVVSALGKKSEKGVVGVNRSIPEGDRITARLDINAYTDYDVWIPTLTHPEKKTMYSPTVVLQDVSFIQPDDKAVGMALNVATGKAKAPFAVMEGNYRSMSDSDAFEYAKQAFDDENWTQVGYDPTRRGFFYDRKTGEPVLNAEEVVQVGHLVLAKNAVKGDADAFPFKKGGAVPMRRQMELFEQVQGAFDEGGLMQEGGTVDPESGNEVPVGSMQEEVRDDIPAQLSEGEFVFPADVVRYIGLEKLMQMRQEAKRGLEMMDKMGQMGNADEAVIPDDIPFDMSDLDMEDDGMVEFAEGGVVEAQQGTFVPPTGVNFTSGVQRQSQYTAPDFTTPVMPPVQIPVMPPIQPPVQGPVQSPVPTLPKSPVPGIGDFLGSGQGGQGGGAAQLITIVNTKTGAERQINFIPGVTQIPEGFVRKEDYTPTEKPATETPKAIPTVQQQQDESPADSVPSTTDATGIAYDRGKIKNKDLKTALSAAGLAQAKDVGPAITALFTGSATGLLTQMGRKAGQAMGYLAGNKQHAGAVLGGVLDEFRGAGEFSIGQSSLDQLSDLQQQQIADTFKSVTEQMSGLYTKEVIDKDGNVEVKTKSQSEIINSLRSEASKLNISTTFTDRRGNTRNKSQVSLEREISTALTRKALSKQRTEKAKSIGQSRRDAAKAAAAALPAGYKVDTKDKSATEILIEVKEQQAKKARDDATRAAEAARDFDYSSGDPDPFGGTGQMGGSAAEQSSGYQTSTGEAMVAEGGLIKKAKLAQQMKQSGLASKK